jgi:acetyl esterase/lipase
MLVLLILGGIGMVAERLYAQTSTDPTLRWATIAANEYQSHANIVYSKANGQDLKLDVITAGPASQPRPTLIYIHGGGWLLGQKENSMIQTLPYLAKGMNVVNVEYRLSSVSLAPAAVEDCRCALRWVYHSAKQYGFDVSKIVVTGHSAGGHLSLMTGMLDSSAGFDNGACNWWPLEHEPFKVAAIVDFYGITDVVDVLSSGPHQQDYAVAWFGSLPDRFELAKRVSPLTYVRPGLPPILIIHGDADTVVPYEEGVRLHQALDKAGVANEMLTIPGGKHGGWTREQNLQAQDTVFRFLEKHGILQQ